ncbi:MAG: ribokinase [Chloroflexi bacterium]|nr:MAG: ribokinase [Phototrophicales bacterium]RMF78908.1 MAG: ribokinase [Chloroflexota bacterium]
MPAKIVVVGSFNTDLTSYMERLPEPGETVNGRKFVVGPGGKGSNQAVAAARLGAEVTFVGRVGKDHYGQIALDLWRNEGINTEFVVQDGEQATGVAPIFVDDSGENMIVVALGANLALTPSDVDAAADVIAGADILITQLEIRRRTAGQALQIARDNGVRTILNPAPAVQLPAEFLALADIITPNQTELQILTGVHSESLEQDAKSLLVSPSQTVVLTMGAWGAMWVRQDAHAHIESFKVETVDTTGAGDAFNGGLAVGLAEGMDISEAVRFAGATAAMCVTKPGTAPSMPTRAEVEALMSTTT